MSSLRPCTAVTISPWRNRNRMMSAALRLSLGPTSFAVEPRSMMMSPSGTGADCSAATWSSGSARALRRCDGDDASSCAGIRVVRPIPRLAGPPRFGPPGAPRRGTGSSIPGSRRRRRRDVTSDRRCAADRRSGSRAHGSRSTGPGGVERRRRRAIGTARAGRRRNRTTRWRSCGRPGGGGIGRPVATERRARRRRAALARFARCRALRGSDGRGTARRRRGARGRGLGDGAADCARPWVATAAGARRRLGRRSVRRPVLGAAW